MKKPDSGMLVICLLLLPFQVLAQITFECWYGGAKLMEHTESGALTGESYDITTSPTDIVYKYEENHDGPGFFVGNHSSGTVDFYYHTLTNLESGSWRQIKSTSISHKNCSEDYSGDSKLSPDFRFGFNQGR